jgi:predicted  nucleic acid-binding Zn-ribbon protein
MPDILELERNLENLRRQQEEIEDQIAAERESVLSNVVDYITTEQRLTEVVRELNDVALGFGKTLVLRKLREPKPVADELPMDPPTA